MLSSTLSDSVAHKQLFANVDFYYFFSVPAPFSYEFWSQSRPFSFTYRASLVGRTLSHGRCHSIRKYLRISDAKVWSDWISIFFHWMWSDSCCMPFSTSDCISVNTYRFVWQRLEIMKRFELKLNFCLFECRANTINVIQEVWIQCNWMTFSSRFMRSLSAFSQSANVWSMKLVSNALFTLVAGG